MVQYLKDPASRPLLFLLWFVASTCQALELKNTEFLAISNQPHSLQEVDPTSIFATNDNTTAWEQRTLPDYWSTKEGDEGGQGWYRLRFELDEQVISSSNNWAIYVPKHSRVMALYLNEKRIGDTGQFSMPLSDNFVRPYLFPIHSSLLNAGENQILIRLAGYSFDEISLSKIFIDTEDNLNGAYRLRYGFGVGVALIGFYSMSLMAILVFLFWLFRPGDTQYLWFSLTSLFGAMFASNRLITDFPLPITAELQSVFYNSAVSLYTLCCVVFLHRFTQLKPYNRERFYFFIICVYAVTAIALPAESAFFSTNLMHVVDAAYGIYILYFIYHHRDRNAKLDLYVVLGLCCLAYALSFNDLLLRLVDKPYSSWLTMQWAPLLIYIAFVSLILSRLFRTLRGFEQLTDALQKRVADKSQQVIELEKKQAVNEERRRIMFDLHDGIGGQLVNAVNYLNRHPGHDAVLLETVNTALQDLRFVVDSIDSSGEQEVYLLLGTFRERFEPIIQAQGIQFVWDVDETFNAETLGPSASLNLLRILQEAVTNAIKHGEPDTIYIRTSENTIEVEDNGIGFDPTKKPGLGIRSMKERANNIGMTATVTRTDRGTRVILSRATNHF